MATGKKLPDSTVSAIGDFVCENPAISYENLTPMVNEKFGVNVDVNWIKQKAQKLGWHLRRKMASGAQKKEVNHFDPNTMVTEIAEILYQSIIKDWETNEELNPAKVNSFMNLLDKADIKIRQTSSGKTPQQQIIDLIASLET